MAVYVDDVFVPFGRMVMCHMAADSTAELCAMADKIGVARRWIQKAGTDKEHFDVSKCARQKAIDFGAIPVSCRDLCRVGWSRGPMDFEALTPIPERRIRRQLAAEPQP